MSRRRRRQRGFTLVELVVVVADIALLASILVPIVGRVIDEAKIARAQNETQVIAAAILKFYSDVGIFPARSASVLGTSIQDNYVRYLVSGTALPTGEALNYGYTSSSNITWCDPTDSPTSPYIYSTFDYLLVANKPDNNATLAYSTALWKGPYMKSIKTDPWGHYYSCNIGCAWGGSNKMCVVISAGPNGYFDTAVSPAGTSTGPSGDDIWTVVVIRP